jgi:hypothetical protein
MNRRFRLLAATVATGAVLAGTPLVSGTQATAEPSSRPQPTRGYDVLFVRHAASDYNPPEEALNGSGIQQAATLAETLSDEPVDSVYTSMMMRAFQTGDNVAEDHGLPVLADADINEIGYDFTGVCRQTSKGGAPPRSSGSGSPVRIATTASVARPTTSWPTVGATGGSTSSPNTAATGGRPSSSRTAGSSP